MTNAGYATQTYCILCSVLTVSWCYSITMKPDGPIVYSASTESLTITCSFTLPASQAACNTSKLVISKHGYSNSLICPPDYPLSCAPLSYNLTTEWASSVNASVSYPNHSTIECTIRFSTIQVDNYTCSGYIIDAPVETKPFVILTAELPSHIGISLKGRGPTLSVTALEGDNITLTCFANRSRPNFVLTWKGIGGMVDLPHIESDSAGWFSSSSSVSFVATADMNGVRVTCSGMPQGVTNWPAISVNTDVYLVVHYGTTLLKTGYSSEYGNEYHTRAQEGRHETRTQSSYGTGYGHEYLTSSQEQGRHKTQNPAVFPVTLQLQATAVGISRTSIISLIIGGTVAIAVVIVLVILRSVNGNEAKVSLSAKGRDRDDGKSTRPSQAALSA